jgi:hypothetical protein
VVKPGNPSSLEPSQRRNAKYADHCYDNQRRPSIDPKGSNGSRGDVSTDSFWRGKEDFPPMNPRGVFLYVHIFADPGQSPREFFGFSDRTLRFPYSTGCIVGEGF